MGGQRCVDEKRKGVAESIQYATRGEVEKLAKQECREKSIFGVRPGSVFLTEAPGFPKATCIIHAVTMRFPGSKAHLKTIEKLVPEILKVAEFMNFRTISIPMLGCGTGRLSEKEVMKIFEQYFSKSHIIFYVHYFYKETIDEA